jgi:hypothetical protein
MNRRGTAPPPIFGRLTHITTSTEECSVSCAKLPQESSRLVPQIEGIGNRCKTFKQGCLCRWGGSNPRCTPECSTIIDASSFVAYLTTAAPHTKLAVRGRGIGRGKSTDYQTFDDNGLERRHFRGKSASAGTGPVPSFWIRSIVMTH